MQEEGDEACHQDYLFSRAAQRNSGYSLVIFGEGYFRPTFYLGQLVRLFFLTDKVLVLVVNI